MSNFYDDVINMKKKLDKQKIESVIAIDKKHKQKVKDFIFSIKKGSYTIEISLCPLISNFNECYVTTENQKWGLVLMDTEQLLAVKESLCLYRRNNTQHYVDSYNYFIDMIDEQLKEIDESVAQLGAIL
jgi:Txe/YoeB family toxin of Txe-Axe toxin-antitoxin module